MKHDFVAILFRVRSCLPAELISVYSLPFLSLHGDLCLPAVSVFGVLSAIRAFPRRNNQVVVSRCKAAAGSNSATTQRPLADLQIEGVRWTR